MPREITNDGVLIAKVMRDKLNDWPDKPCVVMLETLKKDPPSMMLQQLASAEKVRQYVNGSYIGAWSFAVYIRVRGNDTASRLDAIGVLERLGDWLTELNSDGSFKRLPIIDESRTATSIATPPL